MMKLSTMKLVMETLDEKWQSRLAEELLSPWDYEPGTVYFVRASANFIFRFKYKRRGYFLRFNSAEEKELSGIQCELDILDQLSRNEKRTVKPVVSKKGNTVEKSVTLQGTFYSSVFEELPGSHIDLEKMDSSHLYEWGRALGSLHNQFSKLPDGYLECRDDPQSLLETIKGWLPARSLKVERESARIETEISSWPKGRDTYGYIHFDCEPDNVLFNEGITGIIDFDDSMKNWYGADIIYALRDLGEFNEENERLKVFLQGYRSRFKLEADFFEKADWYIRFHQLYMYARMLRSVDIQEQTSDPNWLRVLRNKLLSKIEQYETDL
ncbi:phosphotransferase enzyme family protein [Peribacillus sp. SCS-37]|uniref:phosphotransferase enzyme family protein n=1 Tax=Paraperibacillus esterisolvens TaxID=3115296 RepID=UPI003905F5FF